MPTWCGIDIGSSVVRVAVVRSSYRKTTLHALAAAQIVRTPGGDDAAAVVEAVRAAVHAAHAGKAASGDGVAAAIEGSRVAVRTLTLPASVAKQLNEVLAFELESQVPFEMDDAVFDHRLLAPPKDGTLTVLAAVARAPDVRARIAQVTAGAGVEPERIAIGPFALAQLVPYVPGLADAGPVVILDIGPESSDVLVLVEGEPVFARTVSFGTDGLPGTAPRLAREIRVSLSAYRSAGGVAPTAVFLCGGGAFSIGAESFLAGELQIPVAVLPPLAIEIGALAQGAHVTPEALAEMPRYAKAVGLALTLGARPGTALNLRRGVLSYERGFGWVTEKVPVLSGLAAVILVSFLFSTGTRLYATSKDTEIAEKALGTVTKDVLGEETTSAARANELLGQQTSVNDEDPLPHADVFDVMNKISEAIPTSMTHDIEELDLQKGKVILHGIVGSIPDAQSIAQSLRTEKCFSDVKIRSTTQMVGTERQKYILDLELKCPEDVKGGKKPGAAAGAASAANSAGGK